MAQRGKRNRKGEGDKAKKSKRSKPQSHPTKQQDMPDEQFAQELASMGEVLAQDLSDRVRQWCFAKGIVPHEQLDVTSGLMLAATIEATGTAPAGQSPSVADLHRTLQRMANEYEAQTGETGVMAAAEQVMKFLDETPPEQVFPDLLGADLDDEDELAEEDLPELSPELREILRLRAEMIAAATETYWQSRSVQPAEFAMLQQAAAQVLLGMAYHASHEETVPSATQLLQATRQSIHETDSDSPPYLQAADQVIDFQLAATVDPTIGPWIVDQLSDRFDPEELRDAFLGE